MSISNTKADKLVLKKKVKGAYINDLISKLK